MLQTERGLELVAPVSLVLNEPFESLDKLRKRTVRNTLDEASERQAEMDGARQHPL